MNPVNAIPKSISTLPHSNGRTATAVVQRHRRVAPAAATQHVPLVWLDCFWTTAISGRAEHEHQPESHNHRTYMNASENIRLSAPQLFAPSSDLVYAIGRVERLTRAPQRRNFDHCRHVIVSPVEETNPGV